MDSNYEAIGAQTTERPLFGETTTRDRVLNLIVGLFTATFVLITLILTLTFHRNWMNIFFALTIVLICGSHLVLIYWYRQGDLEPRFRNLIFYNAFTIILLCVCANFYINLDHCHKTNNSTIKAT